MRSPRPAANGSCSPRSGPAGDASVVADGYSCRTQIRQATGGAPVHLAHLAAAVLAPPAALTADSGSVLSALFQARKLKGFNVLELRNHCNASIAAVMSFRACGGDGTASSDKAWQMSGRT